MQIIIVIGIVAIALSVLIRGIYLALTGEKGCKCANGSCPFLNDEGYWWHQDIPCTTGEETDGCTK